MKYLQPENAALEIEVQAERNTVVNELQFRKTVDRTRDNFGNDAVTKLRQS